MTASVKLLRAAARAHQGGADEEDLGIAKLVSALRSDLDTAGSRRRETLQGLIDVLTAKAGKHALCYPAPYPRATPSVCCLNSGNVRGEACGAFHSVKHSLKC